MPSVAAVLDMFCMADLVRPRTPTVGIMRFSMYCRPSSCVMRTLHSVCQSKTLTSHSLYAEGTRCSGNSTAALLHARVSLVTAW